MLYKAKMIQK